MDFPTLDESAIRETAVRDLFDRIDRAGTRLGIAAQKHGVALAGGASVEADAAWRESERELRQEKLTFAILTRDARRVILEALADAPVVHETPESSAVIGHTELVG